MNSIINNCLTGLNNIGWLFCDYSARALIQSSVLIILLLILDSILRKRVRAVFRYCVWMLVFVKLILPPSFSLPTGIGYWWGGFSSAEKPILQQVSDMVPQKSARVSLPEVPTPLAVSPVFTPFEPSEAIPEAVVPAEPVVLALTLLTWQAVVFVLWLIGVLVFLVLLIQRVFFVKVLIAQSSPAEGRLLEALDSCRQQIGVHRDIKIRLSNNTSSPAVCGLLHPIILMPGAILDKMSPDNIRAVLIHELAHIKRGDLWVNLMQTILQVIYFYNPFVWLTNAIVRRIREQAVDETVLVALGAEAKSYSNTLIDIAEMAFWKANFSLRLIGVAESKKALEGRIKYMLARPIPKSAKIGVFGLLSVMIIAAIFLPMAAAANKEKGESHARFSATLPNGVTVELVGICDWPKEGKRCWRPDGSPLSEEIYATKGNQNPGAGDFGFMFKVNGPQDLDFSWNKIEGTTGWEGSCKVIDAQDKQLEGFEAAISDMKEGQLATTIRVGIAAGPWTTIASYDGSRINIGRQGGVLWSKAFETRDGTHIVASAEWQRDRAERVIAIDKDGKLHTTEHSSVASGNVDQLTASFWNLKLNQIKEFQYQIRPYDWFTVRNVSLQPGVQTDVQVEVEKSDVPAKADSLIKTGSPDVIKQVEGEKEQKPRFVAKLSGGGTVELVGVSRNPTEGNQWWQPDGSPLTKPPYHSRGGDVVIQDDDQFKAYQFVARVSGVSGEDMRWQVPEGTKSTYTGQPMDETGQRIFDLRAMAVNQPRGKENTLVRIGVAAGQWETVAAHDSKNERTYDIDGSAVSFGVAYEKDNITYLPITYTKDGFSDKAVRVFAVDFSGNDHTGSASGWGGGVLSSQTYEFRLPLKDIKEFQFKTRSFQWVEFYNVSLQLGQKTDVQVDVVKEAKEAVEAAFSWLKLVDNSDYGRSWDEAAKYLKNAVNKEQFRNSVESARKPLGKVISRKVKSKRYTLQVPGGPDGEYVIIQFDTSFENKKSAIETVTPMFDKDSVWRVSGYYIN